MGITERRQAEIESTKRKIIDATLDILAEDGYENLSIRKIANKIEYSPGIIYHYFKDKSEIVNCIVEEKYANIVKIINEVPVDYENPHKTITDTLRVYIDFMLSSPEQFKAMLMNDVESVREKVNMLDEGISKKRKSIGSLRDIISSGIENGKFREGDAELTAQIIWTSTYGLILRLILENNITKEQREKLINHHFDIIINGILK
jgi:AcrR family transcriptional regulator